MAFALHNYALATLLLILAILPFEGTCASHHHHHHNRNRLRHRHKSLHFTLFQHETINKTGYAIVSGIEGGGGISESTSPSAVPSCFEDLFALAVKGS